MNREVILLMWQVDGRFNSLKATMGMVRGESFGIVVLSTPEGNHMHRSQGFDTPEEAEAYLLAETDYAGDEMLLPPTERRVPAPNAVHVDSAEFKLWVHDCVLKAVDREILHRRLASITLKFGEPKPAFIR